MATSTCSSIYICNAFRNSLQNYIRVYGKERKYRYQGFRLFLCLFLCFVFNWGCLFTFNDTHDTVVPHVVCSILINIIQSNVSGNLTTVQEHDVLTSLPKNSHSE